MSQKVNFSSCQQRLVGAVEELLSLDLGFGTTNPLYQDVEILSNEEDPVDFGPTQMQGESLIHGGYAFPEDIHVVDNNMEGPMIVPIYEVEAEDYVFGNPEVTMVADIF
ncbi:hypothetical protein POM88_043040 [Heracleum sosnowskyi]|uniref:Uncharacterized protein n=1 Tax=Heracleum sosnowskyi TaxID=360622 RepID=A0AAD8HHX7_9APIA|nr:hypothetical protein POM88_043040 [Heracleum sosnowskyi]